MNLVTSTKVKLFGINEKDTVKFSTIFRINRPNKISYCVVNDVAAENIDIAIVNTDSNAAYEQYQLINRENPRVALVTAGSNQSPHHLSGMLLPSRVYNVLDKVPIAHVCTEQHASPAIENDAQRELQQPAPSSIRSGTVVPQAKTQILNFGAVEPEASEPNFGAVEPEASEPKAAEPEVAEPEAVEPEAVEPEAVEPEAAESEVDKQELAYQVLVVDDSESMQKALQLELEQVECALEIDFALSGEEGLKRIDEKKYDLIFMDVMMPLPGIDGFEACSIIRKIPEMKKTPIIMLTAKTSPLDEVKGIVSGCTTYLTKPLKKDNFQAVMKRVLKWLENYRK